MTANGTHEAVARFGTPCYVYDEERIAANAARFLSIRYPAAAVHFASMANDNPFLLQLLRGLGLGVFVNSEKHLHAVLAAGFRGQQIIYAASGLTAGQMRLARQFGARLHLDSVGQVATYGAAFRGDAVGVRLNIAERSRGRTLPAETSRIGITADELEGLFDVAGAHGLRLKGTHVYLGTNIRTPQEMLAGVEAALELSMRFPDLEYIDFGGGFPPARDPAVSFDFEAYATSFADRMERYSRERGRPIGMIIEPGRALLADAATFCTRITDVKEREDRIIAACDASVSIFPRPLISGEFHPARLCSENGAPVSKPVDVVGSTTFSGDYLVRGAPMPRPKIGDVVEIELAGSYCYSMMTRFLGQAAPPEVLICADGRLQSIREREPVRWAD